MGNVDTRGLIVFLLIGLVAGWLASIIVGGGGIIRYILTGVIGSFVGGFLLSALGVRLGISNPLVNQVVTAAIGAIVVVLAARILT
jgi:uncharacterized membrane protein YeaQ/YmgE (transglycosylase-associated protein family)